MAVLNYDILLTKKCNAYEKDCLLLVGVLALFSCQQRNWITLWKVVVCGR